MKTIKNVKSKNRPVDIDDYSSPTTIFVHKNIREVVEMDPVFKTETTVFIYDEEQYQLHEWSKLVTDSIKEEGAVIQERVDITQLALTEILDIVGTFAIPSVINNISHNLLSNDFSAIVKMYGNMISRGLITIDNVNDNFKQDVIEYLNSKE